jgi:hypothetical protein
MVSRHQELTRSHARDEHERFALGPIPTPPPPLPPTSVSSTSSASIQVWLIPPVAKKEVIVEVNDDSSPFEWMSLESEDYFHDPHMMRV